jgi:hypothetical protein
MQPDKHREKMSTTAHFIDHGQHSIIRTREPFRYFLLGTNDRTLQIKLIVPATTTPPAQLAADQAVAEIHLDYALAKRLAEGILKQF